MTTDQSPLPATLDEVRGEKPLKKPLAGNWLVTTFAGPVPTPATAQTVLPLVFDQQEDEAIMFLLLSEQPQEGVLPDSTEDHLKVVELPVYRTLLHPDVASLAVAGPLSLVQEARDFFQAAIEQIGGNIVEEDPGCVVVEKGSAFEPLGVALLIGAKLAGLTPYLVELEGEGKATTWPVNLPDVQLTKDGESAGPSESTSGN